MEPNEQAGTAAGKTTEPSAKRISNVRHPDYVMYDQVRIGLVERWKESELSGDEYRFSACIELLWKGRVIHTNSYGSVKAAILALGYETLRAGDNGVPNELLELEKRLCNQPGCENHATTFYRVKAEYDRAGHKTELPPSYNPNVLYVTGFCDQHKHRGDCSLQDADRNYEPIDNPWPHPIAQHVDLHGTTDAVVWAQDFMQRFSHRRQQIDESLMLSWFANAIEVGRAAGKPSFSRAFTDVLQERCRQVDVEGHTSEHDEEHSNGELAAAGAAYALSGVHHANKAMSDGWSRNEPPSFWPWGRSEWKPKEQRRDLVRAAALILAEIERLDFANENATRGA